LPGVRRRKDDCVKTCRAPLPHLLERDAYDGSQRLARTNRQGGPPKVPTRGAPFKPDFGLGGAFPSITDNPRAPWIDFARAFGLRRFQCGGYRVPVDVGGKETGRGSDRR
jgi:hypothetical protein